jgi:hypothetical protein
MTLEALSGTPCKGAMFVLIPAEGDADTISPRS